MLLVNTEHIPGHDYEVLGLVRGSTIQTKHIGKDIGSSFKTLVGGERFITPELKEKAREYALRRYHG